MNIPLLILRVEVNQPRKLFYTLKLGRSNKRSLWVRLKLAQDKVLVSWLTISNTIILYESTPADCSFKVIRRNLDDTEAAILCKRKSREQKEAPRMKFHEAPKQEPAQGNLMRERAAIRLTPREITIELRESHKQSLMRIQLAER